MKVLLINDYAVPRGGAEIQMRALRDHLRRRGHDARLFATRADDGQGLADYECFGTRTPFRTILQAYNLWAESALRRVLSAFRPDVVHVRIFLTQLSPLILRPLRHFPSLYQVVWYRCLCPLGTKLLPDGSRCRETAGLVCARKGCLPWRDTIPLTLQGRLFRRWQDSFNLFVANSQAVKARLVEAGMSPVELVYNGVIDRGVSMPTSVTPKIVFAGRLVREKGVDVLCRAFPAILARHPDATLTIAGDGPDRDRLRRLINESGMAASVHLTGHLTPEQLHERCAGAWVQVIPSVWDEPCANVILEAMMRGTAVVATSCGGSPEILPDGTAGLLVPPSDSARLGEAVLQLLADPRRCEEMGQAGRRWAESRFGFELCTSRFVELYQQVSSAAQRSHGADPLPEEQPA